MDIEMMLANRRKARRAKRESQRSQQEVLVRSELSPEGLCLGRVGRVDVTLPVR
jgi:hypothetical protein